MVHEIVLVIPAWAAKEPWRISKGLLQSLAELAIAETMAPKVCRACNATGEVWDYGQQVGCQACGAAGLLPWSMRQRQARGHAQRELAGLLGPEVPADSGAAG